MATLRAWLIAAALLMTAPDAAIAAPYTLAAGDAVRVIVAGNPDLSVERTMVQADGSLLLPRIGPVNVNGLTPDESRKALATTLRNELGISQPEVTVEILEYRPFYVVGDVEKQGSYPYVPGLTVVQAIARAGGFARSGSADASLRIEAGQLRERLGQYREQMAITLVRHARNLAERDGDALELPRGVTDYVSAERAEMLLRHERDVKAHRSEGLEAELDVSKRLSNSLDEEIAALTQKLEPLRKRSEALQEEERRLSEFMKRDLVTLDRQMTLRRDQQQALADILETQAYISRARTGKAQAEKDMIERRNARRLQILEAVRDSEDTIATTRRLIDSTLDQLSRVDRLSAEIATSRRQRGEQFGFDAMTILRRQGEKTIAIGAGLGDQLCPDDVLIVPMALRHAEQASHVVAN